jgi:alkylation response protein AidB-like acyl-CoA dehydrogenase
LDFSYSAEELALQKEVREFLKNDMPPQVPYEVEHEKGWEGPYTRAFVRRLGAKGWLTPSWPREYGGLGATYMQRYIIGEEMSYFGGPRTLIGATMAGPTILLYGTEEQKKEFLPPVARGEIEFALGYTEPEAGSDLAAMDIRAVEKDDHYLINGQKIFNTGCHYSDYHWLGARTDPQAPRHRGISLFIVDLKSPGISLDPIITMAGYRTNAVYYDNVRVPKKNMVGEKNKGWYQIATALDFERTYEAGGVERQFHVLLDYCRHTRRCGQPVTQDIKVRQKLAKIAVEIEVLKLFAVRLACLLNKGTVPNYEAAMAKLFGSELEQRLSQTGAEILGLYCQLQEGDKLAPMDGRLELYHRMTVRWTIVRGSSEIMRTLIATRGLGMPRG